MSIGKSKIGYMLSAGFVLVLILCVGSLVWSSFEKQKLHAEMACTILRLKEARIFTPVVLKYMDTFDAFMYIWDTAPEEKALGKEYAQRVLREDPDYPKTSTKEAQEAIFYLQHFHPDSEW